MENQRAHRRLNVDFDAYVTAEGLREHPCKVRDFCLGGSLLSFDDPLRPLPPAFLALQRGMMVDVRVVTRTPGARDTYTFSAVIARRDGAQLGIAFRNPDPTSLMALQSLANVNNAQQRMGVRDFRKPKVDEATLRKALAGLRSVVRQSIADLPARLVADLQKPVTDLAARESGPERTRLIESLDTLRRYATGLQAGFLQQALKPLDDFDNWQPGALLPAGSASSRLSLIDKNAFEDWLAIKVMVSRAEADCKAPLFELHIRMNELLGAQLSVQNNPVGPAVFFHALGEPIQKLKLPRPVEQLLLRQVESAMLERLAVLYPALNDELVRHGILPDLEVGKYARAQSYGAPRPAAPAPAAAPVAAAAPAVTPAPVANPAPAEPAAPAVAGGNRAALAVRQFELQQKIARQAYGSVQRLLAARQAALAGAAGEATAATPAWDPALVARALDTLQKAAPGEDAPVSLRERLAASLGTGGDRRALPPAEARAAETVDELFAQMLGTALLRDDTRALIRRLDVPFLKLLMADPEFLANERHPARRVLNQLASLGARGAMTTPQQQQKMQAVVDDLVQRFGSDPAVFDAAADVLGRMLEQQRKVYQHNLQRVRQSSEGQHRINAARRQVLQALEGVIGGRRVPRAALTLLDSGWRESLVATLLRHGVDSEPWRVQFGVIRDMVDGLDNPATLDMKALLATIKHGMASQAAGQINRDTVVGDLRDMFTALSAGRPDDVPVVDVPVGAVDSEVRITLTTTEGLGRWLQRARETAVGEWVEFRGEEGEDAQQARLAWRDEACSQFVFVNLQGMKVLEMDIDDLARALRDGRARRIDDPDSPLVDRGLEAMVQKVYGQLAHRAMHDELTGLLTRKEFEKVLQREVDGLKGSDRRWVLGWLDLDQFKVINSTCGFEAGDALIRQVARAIADACGPDARVGRLGGDEFAVLLPLAGDTGPEQAAMPLLRAVEHMRFVWQGKPHPLTASAGLVLVDSTVPTSEGLMQVAEGACDAAKEAGRNRVQLYKADDVRLARRDDILQWVSRLNHAIEQDRLQLRCQRIVPVDPQSGVLPHYEILIAIEDENGEFIPPSAFMLAAERYNRMQAVDRWVIRHALQWMADNPAVLATVSGFSINLSGQSINDEKLTAYVRQQVLDSGVPREKITFEVTETTAIANLADAADFIREMQSLGCRFSLDDFGSGLSSYSYLKNLPVDDVKIDGAFIRELDKNPSDYIMVRSINEMAHFMGKRTIAEYVESEEILARLREIGVDYAQGYAIERPVPLKTLAGQGGAG